MRSRNNREEGLRREAMKLRHQFAQGGQGVFSEVLSPEAVASVIKEECGDYRERLYPPLVTLRLFIGQALSEDKAGVSAELAFSNTLIA